MGLNLSRISLLTLVIFLPACFRLTPSIEASDNLELAKANKENLDQYCSSLSLAYKKIPVKSQLPEFLLEYGDCLTRENSAVSPNSDSARNIYSTSARCGNAQAKEKLQSLGIQIPEEDGRRAGEYIWLDFSDEKCGLDQELTGLGTLLTAPILIPLVIVAIPLAIFVGPPVCFIMVIFNTEGGCK